MLPFRDCESLWLTTLRESALPKADLLAIPESCSREAEGYPFRPDRLYHTLGGSNVSRYFPAGVPRLWCAKIQSVIKTDTDPKLEVESFS
jgi:hypothetical protein